MNKEDILTIQELLCSLNLDEHNEPMKTKLKNLTFKVSLIVEQIEAQDKIQEVQNQLMELDKPKEEK